MHRFQNKSGMCPSCPYKIGVLQKIGFFFAFEKNSSVGMFCFQKKSFDKVCAVGFATQELTTTQRSIHISHHKRQLSAYTLPVHYHYPIMNNKPKVYQSTQSLTLNPLSPPLSHPGYAATPFQSSHSKTISQHLTVSHARDVFT